jgi:hypothetical protein
MDYEAEPIRNASPPARREWRRHNGNDNDRGSSTICSARHGMGGTQRSWSVEGTHSRLRATRGDIGIRPGWRRRDQLQPAVFTGGLAKISKLGGYLDRAHHPAPDNFVMWLLSDVSNPHQGSFHFSALYDRRTSSPKSYDLAGLWESFRN